jgi:prepilin-type N-terminal cleavage/methylation domain-containing protein
MVGIMKPHPRDGFTLLELLVVIAIIGILVALTASALMKARSAADRLACGNNLRQIGLGLLQYHNQYAVFPPGCENAASGSPYPFMSWSVRLLPFLEQEQVWAEAEQDFATVPEFRAHAIRKLPMKVFACPADARMSGNPVFLGLTSYQGTEGGNLESKDGILFLNSAVRIADIRDGTSNTLMVGERPPSADYMMGWWYGGWGQLQDGSVDLVLGVAEKNVFSPYWDAAESCPPGPYQFAAGSISNNCDAFHFWSLHIGGANFLCADGSVHFIPYSASGLMPQLASRSGGEVAPVPD